MTDELVDRARAELARIDDLGGTLAALADGYQQNAIGDAAYDVQREIEAGERIVVGLNRYHDAEAASVEPQVIDPVLEAAQVERTDGERAAPDPRLRRGAGDPRRDLARPARRVGGVPAVTGGIGPIHHVAVVVRSIEASLPRYRSLFGLEPEAEPMVFASQRVRLCFVPTGPDLAARLELIEPVDDDSGVARFLAARGEGVHHVCLLTDDLPDELDRLATAEAELIDRESRPGAHWSVAFVHPRSLNGVRWELLEEG